MGWLRAFSIISLCALYPLARPIIISTRFAQRSQSLYFGVRENGFGLLYYIWHNIYNNCGIFVGLNHINAVSE